MKKVKGMTSRIAAMLLSAMLAAGSVPGIVFASAPQWDPGRYLETAAEGSNNAWEPGMSNGLQEGNEETANDGSADEAYAAAENTAVDDEENNPVMDEAAVDEKTNEEGTAADTEWIGAVPEQETAGSGEVQENADYSGTVETVSEEDPFGQTEDQALVDDGMPEEDALSETAQDTLAEDAAAGDTLAEDAAAGDTLAEDAAAGDTFAEDAAAGDTFAEDAAAGDTFAEDAAAGDTFAEDAAVGDAVTEDAATEDAASENPLISEGETETTEEQPSNADIAGTIIDRGVCGNDGKVTWTLDKDGKLIIEGQGEMEDYQDGDAPWYKYRDSIFTVVVESGVIDIGTYAFSGCSSISSIEFQEGLVNIFYHAFSGCSSISSIEFPEGLLNIYDYAFSGCGSLTSVKLPNSLEAIHTYVFSGCGSLTSIELPESLKHIFEGGFSDCSSLTSIELPNSMTSVDANVFSGCSSLTSVELPECLEYIGTNAFSNCSSLTSIELPESLTYISAGGFSGCSSLTSIELPEGFDMIQTDVFSGCSNLERIKLPASIAMICNAFSGCISLSEVIYVGTQWCWDQVYVIPGQAEFNGATKMFLNKNCIRYATVTGLSDMTYTGEALTQSPVVEYNGTILTEGTDYRVSYENNINHGSAGVIITGKGDYIGIKNESFWINQAPQTITASNLSLTYLKTGTIKVSGSKGKLSFTSSNTAVATVDSAGKVTAKGAGKATITITAAATNNYNTATKQITVTVAKAAQSITAKAAASSVAVGKTTTVSITGAKGTKSYKSSDTTVAAVNASTGLVTAKKVGTVKITATSAATSNYNAASKTVTIKVVPAATASLAAENQAAGIKLTWKKVTGANGYKVYRGTTLIKTITSGSTVTFADAKANTNGTKYTYKVVAKGTTGDSTLSRSRVIYRVARPAVSSVTNTAASKMTIKWGKNAKATGYVIHYSTDKTFKSGNKSVTVTSASTVSRVISSLTKGKTYYVRIRTYKTVGSAKYWSMWSAARSVKISK